MMNDLAFGLTRFSGSMSTIVVAMMSVGIVTVFVVQFLKPGLRWLFVSKLLLVWLSRFVKPNLPWLVVILKLFRVPILRYGVYSRLWLHEWEQADEEFEKYLFNRPGWLRKFTEPSPIKWMSAPSLQRNFFDISTQLPRDFYMKAIENRIKRILEHPSTYTNVFVVVTAGASPFDQALACLVDYTALQDPTRVSRLDDEADYPPTEVSSQERSRRLNYSAVVAAAQDNVAAAAERNLDELQINLAVGWSVTVKLSAILVGILISFLGGIELAGLSTKWWWLMVVIGAVGGYVSAIIYDGVSIIGRLRPR